MRFGHVPVDRIQYKKYLIGTIDLYRLDLSR